MILTNVVQDETMAVPGFEHHTFMCSECQDIERRFAFMKQDRNSDIEGMPEQVAPPVVPASTVQDELVAASDLVTGPMESDETVPLQPTQTAPALQTAPVDEPTVPVEPSQTVAPVATVETRAWAKAFGEKLRKLTARATGLREAVGEIERRAQFNRVWVNLLSAPEGLGQVGPPTRASVSDHIPQLGESDPHT